jgi:hypothetical protein
MLQLTNLVQVITECRSCFERAPGNPRPPIRARTSGPRPSSIRALVVRAQRLDPFMRRVWLAPEAVRAHARSCLRSQLFRLAPGRLPWTANRHVGGQQ